MIDKKIYNDYDAFALFYNKYWTVATPKLMKKIVDKLLLADLPPSSKILDLCCGTGNTADLIQKSGYDVYGIDGSPAMLAYATHNAKKVKFINADARWFKLDFKLDAIICLFDSVNHFITIDDLKQLFKNVYNNLKPDAKFIFDINSLTSSVTVEDTAFTIVNADNVFICNPHWNKKTAIIKYMLTMFINDDGNWLRNDHTIIEKYYEPELIAKLLIEAGFKNLSILDGYDDLKVKEFKDRIFFISWR